MMPDYTVVGLIDQDSGELLIAGVFEGFLQAVDQDSGDSSLERYCGHVVALDPEEAERDRQIFVRSWQSVRRVSGTAPPPETPGPAKGGVNVPPARRAATLIDASLSKGTEGQYTLTEIHKRIRRGPNGMLYGADVIRVTVKRDFYAFQSAAWAEVLDGRHWTRLCEVGAEYWHSGTPQEPGEKRGHNALAPIASGLLKRAIVILEAGE